MDTSCRRGIGYDTRPPPTTVSRHDRVHLKRPRRVARRYGSVLRTSVHRMRSTLVDEETLAQKKGAIRTGGRQATGKRIPIADQDRLSISKWAAEGNEELQVISCVAHKGCRRHAHASDAFIVMITWYRGGPWSRVIVCAPWTWFNHGVVSREVVRLGMHWPGCANTNKDHLCSIQVLNVKSRSSLLPDGLFLM